MKRFILVAILFIFVVGSIWATSDEKQGTLPSSSKAKFKLVLDSDKYTIGFSQNANYESMGENEVELKEDVEEDFTVNLESKEIYFFYRALTDSNTVYLTLKIDTPLCYLNDKTVTDGHDTKKTINYSASLSTDALIWNGVSLTGETLSSNGTKEITRGIRSDTFTDYLAQGICKVTISSTENLAEKVPGTYKSTMTLQLTSM